MEVVAGGFPRGDGPLVSITFVTRGRPDMLARAVDSLHSLAVEKDKLEFLFRADADDEPTVLQCSRLVNLLPNASLLVEPRGAGYKNMHLWVNRLVKLARGDWVGVWNDDAFMCTQDWDQILANLPLPFWHKCPDVAYVHAPTRDRPLTTREFFFVRRKSIEIMGHFFLSPHGDNWIHRVMAAVGSSATCGDLSVKHLSHLMEDQTRKDSVEAYAWGDLARETLESPEAQRGMHESAAKLRAHIDQYQREHRLA